MDPLALTTSIIELGLSIKESIDKFEERRSHAKELASDALVNLRYIAGFYEKNQPMLSHEALGPLRESLDLLKSDLYRVHKRCQIYEPKQDVPRLKRLAMPLKLWMDSDKIEADLIQFEKRIQTSMNRISLLSGARVEVQVTKIESILANSYESRGRIQQFDYTFTQGLLNGDPGLEAFDRPPSELDDIDIDYICLKAMKLIDTISASTITTKVTMALPPIYGTLCSVQPARHNIIFRTVNLQARASSKSILVTDLCENTLALVKMLEHLGVMYIHRRILGTIEKRLRQTLRLGTGRLRLPRDITEEDEEALDYLEDILYYQNLCTLHYAYDQPDASFTCDEDVERASESVRFSRSRLERRASPSSYYRIAFVWCMRPSIDYHAIQGQVEECFSYCVEALEVIQPCITTCENALSHAAALQIKAQVLGTLSYAQARNGDYMSAYHTGKECFSSIMALSNIGKSVLPNDFNDMTFILEYIQEEMPTWISVVCNPENRRTSYIEEYIDEDDVCDGSPRQIEWGIAL